MRVEPVVLGVLLFALTFVVCCGLAVLFILDLLNVRLILLKKGIYMIRLVLISHNI
jgi:hypothetical protein